MKTATQSVQNSSSVFTLRNVVMFLAAGAFVAWALAEVWLS